MKSLIALSVVVALAGVGTTGDEPKETVKPIKAVRRDAPYQAYWLTPAKDGEGAEYQCLLVTHGPVEHLAGQKAWAALPFDNMAMTFQTYKRDSLWDHPFVCVQQFSEVDAKAKTVVMDKVMYAYEPCPLRDVVLLLENPTGTIAIHRRVNPLAGAESTAKAFRLLLQEQLKAEKDQAKKETPEEDFVFRSITYDNGRVTLFRFRSSSGEGWSIPDSDEPTWTKIAEAAPPPKAKYDFIVTGKHTALVFRFDRVTGETWNLVKDTWQRVANPKLK